MYIHECRQISDWLRVVKYQSNFNEYFLSTTREHMVCFNQPAVQPDMSQNSRVFMCRFAEWKEISKEQTLDSINIQRDSKKNTKYKRRPCQVASQSHIANCGRWTSQMLKSLTITVNLKYASFIVQRNKTFLCICYISKTKQNLVEKRQDKFGAVLAKFAFSHKYLTPFSHWIIYSKIAPKNYVHWLAKNHVSIYMYNSIETWGAAGVMMAQAKRVYILIIKANKLFSIKL